MPNIQLKDCANAYDGFVQITLKHGTKPYKIINEHNTGTVNFFRYMLRAISGESVSTIRPGLIKLYNGTESLLSSGVLYSDTSSISSTESPAAASITYNFLVPDILVQGLTINKAKIFSLDGATEYASVDLTEFTVSDKSNLEIKWTLQISNGGN